MATIEDLAAGNLQENARKHLWMHFTRMGAFDEAHEIPIIVRGDGCYVFDQHGNRYLDGLSALYCVNIGHGRAAVAQAGADQGAELGFFTNWGYAHPKAIELATRIATLAPGDLNRVFFTSGGSESVDSALKLCRQYHKLTGNPGRYKVITRKLAYHGTTMGALTATGIPDARRPFEPLFPGSAHVPNTNPYRPEVDGSGRDDPRADRVRGARDRLVRDPRAGPELRRLLRAAARLLPARARDLRRVRGPVHLRRGHLLVGAARDLVRRAALRLPARHHHHGQGPDLVVRADGRGDRLRPRLRAVLSGKNSFPHGLTFGGHPVSSAVALANIDVFEDEGILENVRANEAAFEAMLDSLRDIPIVGDVRGIGYFRAIELVKDRETKETLHRGRVRVAAARLPVGELFKRGLICRADDRGDPVIQLSPPLIAGPEHFEEIALRPAPGARGGVGEAQPG